MTEKDFRVYLQKGLTSQGAFAFKIPDLAQAIVKPCDLVVGYQRQLWLLEAKLRKVRARRGLVPETVVVARSDFRPHQLPTLLAAEEKRQARCWIAACLVSEQMNRVVERRAWLFPALLFQPEERHVLTIEDLDQCFPGHELEWKPKVGWIAPWLPAP